MSVAESIPAFASSNASCASCCSFFASSAILFASSAFLSALSRAASVFAAASDASSMRSIVLSTISSATFTSVPPSKVPFAVVSNSPAASFVVWSAPLPSLKVVSTAAFTASFAVFVSVFIFCAASLCWISFTWSAADFCVVTVVVLSSGVVSLLFCPSASSANAAIGVDNAIIAANPTDNDLITFLLAFLVNFTSVAFSIISFFICVNLFLPF